MVFRVFIALALIGVFLQASGCSIFRKCKDYATHSDIMNSWVGDDLREFEGHVGVRPVDSMKRPRNRTEYSYVTAEERIGGQRYFCNVHLEVDDATGKIMSWSTRGNNCHGYCRRR